MGGWEHGEASPPTQGAMPKPRPLHDLFVRFLKQRLIRELRSDVPSSNVMPMALV